MNEMIRRGEVVDERESRIAVLEEELGELRDENRGLKAALRAKDGEAERSVAKLRDVLSPLFQSLKLVFGEIETIAGPDAGAAVAEGTDSRDSAKWMSWKSQLPPACGRVIDALLTHGELTAPQILVVCKMAPGTLHGGSGVLSRLNRAGLLNKNGNKHSLKKL